MDHHKRRTLVVLTWLATQCAILGLAQAQPLTGISGWGGLGIGGPPDTSGLSNIVAISAKGSWLALQSGGTVPGVPNLSNVTAIASGNSHSLAVTNGFVYGWGDNGAGELNVPTGLSNVVAVAAGVQDSLALRDDGTVVGWGYNGYGQVSIPVGLSNVVRLAAGYYHSLALRADGTVIAWGYNAEGETNVPAGLATVTAIAGGYYHSLALKSDGTVVAWGGNGSGQTQVPAGLSNVVAIAAGGVHSMALKQDGTIVAWGDNFYGQTNIPPGLSNVVDLAGGYSFSLALTNNGLPWVVRPPGSQVIYQGGTATFSATILGQPPLSYQWQSNGVNISGATGLTLTLTNVQANAAAQYRLAVTNSVGGIVTAPAALSVVPPPLITIQPQNLTTNGGATVTFTPVIVGAGPSAYQWIFDGTNLPNATNLVLSLTNVLAMQSGSYALMITNSSGSAVSSNSLLTVQPWVQPSISPNTVVAGSGVYAAFTLTSGGFSTNTVYQWRQNGNSLGGFWAWTSASSGTYVGASMAYAGTYDIVATDPYSSVTSPPAVFTVIPLQITVQPTNRGAWVGGSARFNVSATGATPINYQWQFNGTDIPGATSSSLLLTNVQPAQFGSYSAILTNAYTNMSSAAASLSLSRVVVWGGLNGETNVPPGLTNVIALSSGLAGSSDCEALLQSGTAIIWPAAFPTNTSRNATNLVSIAGCNPSYGLTSKGVVVEWPSDGLGSPGLSNVVAISAYGSDYIALKTNGTVSGYDSGFAFPSGLSNVVAVAEGNAFSVCLKADGTVTAFGANSFGQTLVPPGLNNIIGIAAGGSHALALRSDGTLIGWGDSRYGQTNIPAGLSNVVAIAAGQWHSLALRADGTVSAWGLGVQGQTNVPSGLTNVIAISAGQYHNLALLGDGPPVTQAAITIVSALPNNFTVSLPSQSGHSFVLQYKDSLSDASWTPLIPAPGNGSLLYLSDPSATNAQRYYRVLRW